MSVLDLKNAKRLWVGQNEASRFWMGPSTSWTKPVPAVPVGITGHDAPIQLFAERNRTEILATNYITTTSADDLIVISTMNRSASISTTTLTVGGVTLTPVQYYESSTFSMSAGVYIVESHAVGTLEATFIDSSYTRATAATAWVIKGHRKTTPVVSYTTSDNMNINKSTMYLPNGVVPESVGNVFLGMLTMRGPFDLEATEGVDGGIHVLTGTNVNTDIGSASGYYKATTLDPVIGTYTALTAGRSYGWCVQVAVE